MSGTKINVTLERPEELVKRWMVEQAVNIDPQVVVQVDVANLDRSVREQLLNRSSKYSHIDRWEFYADYPRVYRFVTSAEVPTEGDANLAMLAALGKMQLTQAEIESKAIARQAAADAETKAKADAAAAMANARALLKEELSELSKLKANVETLSEFLASVPDDALVETLKEKVETDKEEAIAELKAKIEKASPNYTIFSKS